MSIWTHVNGNIRYDFSPTSPDATQEGFNDEIENLYGKMIDYDHVGLFGKNHGECPNSNLPCGSEGSIEYEICAASRGFNVSICGDLRNFEEADTHEIITWFEKLMSHQFKTPFYTRDALLHIYVEGGKHTFLISDDSEKKYRVIKEN